MKCDVCGKDSGDGVSQRWMAANILDMRKASSAGSTVMTTVYGNFQEMSAFVCRSCIATLGESYREQDERIAQKDYEGAVERHQASRKSNTIWGIVIGIVLILSIIGVSVGLLKGLGWILILVSGGAFVRWLVKARPPRRRTINEENYSPSRVMEQFRRRKTVAAGHSISWTIDDGEWDRARKRFR